MKRLVWPLIFMAMMMVGQQVFAETPSAAAPKKKVSATDKKSIKLRVVAVNPSAEKTQKVPIKIYLPKEVIPDDIVDMGELKVGYDTDKSLYFAYSEGAELKPKETRVFEVALEDVWKIKQTEIDKLKLQTKRALDHLQSSPYLEQAKSIVDNVDRRIEEILAKQNDESISREEHIGAYRINLRVMDEIKGDIAIIEKLLQTSGGPPSVELLKDTVFESKKDIERITAWKIILGIVGVLGFLALAFFARWFFAIKSRRESVRGTGSDVSIENIPFISESVEEHVGLKGGAEKPSPDKSSGSAQDKRKVG